MLGGTLLKPWRRYSELDGLSDAECEEMVERWWRRDPPPLRAVGVAAWCCAAAWLAAVGVAAFALTPLPDLLRSRRDLLVGGIALAALGSAWLVQAGVRFAIERVLVARTVRRIVAGATCPRCGQSLRGLPIFDDATRPEDRSRMRVRCPECGKVVRLLKHGYTPVDLAAWEERVLPKHFEVRVKR